MMAMSIPVYIGECSPTDKRGQMVTFWQVGVTFGMLIGTAVNVGASKIPWGWRVSYGGNIAFAAFLMIAMATYMPESPRFLASRDKDRAALVATLQKLRYEDDVPHAIRAIDAEIEEERLRGAASWAEVFRKTTSSGTASC